MSATRIRFHLLAAAVLVAAAAGCARSTAQAGGTVRDAFLSQPPHYASAAGALPASTEPIGVLPITFQKHSIRPVLDPPSGPGSALALLIGEMNVYLDSLARSPDANLLLLASAPGPNVAASPDAAQAPDVRFGCYLTADWSIFDCPPARTIENTGIRPQMPTRLTVVPASREWNEWAIGTMQNTRTGSVLVLTIDEGIYRPRQDTYLRTKSVEIGTNHTVSLPWQIPITAVTVLQLTGALVDREGRVVRIGAEGLYAHVPRRLENVEIIDDSNVHELRTMRRSELPGQPLAWQVALRELMRQMTAPTAVVTK